MRIVVDTNVIASAIFFGGKPYQLLHHIMEDRVAVYRQLWRHRDSDRSRLFESAGRLGIGTHNAFIVLDKSGLPAQVMIQVQLGGPVCSKKA